MKKNSDLKLDAATTIVDEEKFVESHLNIVFGGATSRVKKPYFDRLNKYYSLKGIENVLLQSVVFD